MFNNFFLHVQGVKTHVNTLRPAYTLGLGLASFFLLMITTVSGVLLMIYYNPLDRERLQFGKRHHLCRVRRQACEEHAQVGRRGHDPFRPVPHGEGLLYRFVQERREFNWLIGIVLLIITFGINLTGYILPLGPAFLLGLCHRREHHCVAERAHRLPSE